jgi:hypothetical protein
MCFKNKAKKKNEEDCQKICTASEIAKKSTKESKEVSRMNEKRKGRKNNKKD